MNLKFVNFDLEQWAQLSGDRNPIHFNENFAISNGLEGCIVHGMLAMLPMKKIFIEKNSKNPQLNHIRIFLKKSVPLNKELTYIYFNNKVTLNTNGENVYLSKISNIREKYSMESDEDSIPLSSFISSTDLEKKYNIFLKLKGNPYNDFLFWDSILFSIYIANNKSSPLAHNVSSLLEKENLNPKSYVVFQVEHSLTIFNENIENLSIKNIDYFSYNLLGGELIRVDSNIYASVILYLYFKDKPVIKTEMGLLAKLS